MTLKEFCEGIGLESEARQMVYNNILSLEKFGEYDDALKDDRDKFLCLFQGDENSEKVALIFYVMKAIKLFEKFCERGISKEIYFDTFSDITIWCNNYKRKTGRIGIGELEWLTLHLEMKLFRLGRLQFEMSVLEDNISFNDLNYPKGMKVVNVHIPQGKALTEEECDKSFEKAVEFFGPEYKLFICESWLLSPKLKEILGKESNIIKFQNRFCIYNTIYPFRQAEERIFGEVLMDKSQYTEGTSLQKRAKAYLLTHDDIGIGLGILNTEKFGPQF